ncbi:hypothetical protein TNCV_2286481 [Trichonephila clavipes]|nr:hypothetical protein TNCV_2286481 [Trichonephila clavipes]
MSHVWDFGELWIVSNSQRALQHLGGWSSINNETNGYVLIKLRKISLTQDVHLQWSPSRGSIGGSRGNNRLAKEGSVNEMAFGTSLACQ